MKKWIGGLSLGAASTGCADIASSDVRTSGIYADISVEARGNGGSEARVILRAGGASSTTYVQLTGTDRLTVSLEGQTVPMVEESLGVIHHYVATFPSAPVDVDYTLAFERTLDESALNSTVALPPELTLEPAGVDTFSRLDEDLTVSWSPTSTEPVSLAVTGGCIDSWSIDLPSDGGSYVIPRGTLVPRNVALPEGCALDVTVTRTRAGSVDPAFGEGGAAAGRQVRSYSISSTP